MFNEVIIGTIFCYFMSKILVTGGAGYIGSHTCLALLEKNYDVVVIDSFTNSSPVSLERVNKIYRTKAVNNRNIEVIKGDLRSKNDLQNIFNKSKKEGNPIIAVIHFAGLKSVRQSLDNPLAYWDNNVVGTINLLQIMHQNQCFTLVFSSSATVYSLTDNILIDETISISPSSI